MKLYAIEPRDSALFRDSRPFVGNAPAVSMAVPWPSTVAGLFRTLDGLDGDGKWVGEAEAAKKIQVGGPWLVQLNQQGEVVEHYLPAPADAVFFKDPEKKDATKIVRWQLTPQKFENTITDMRSIGGRELTPLSFNSEQNPGKPTSGPAWWSLSAIRDWFGKSTHDNSVVDSKTIGIDLPPEEERTHVGIDHTSGTAKDGDLFSTSMRRFTVARGSSIERFALAAYSAGKLTATQSESTLAPFGGERRLSSINAFGTELPRPVDLGGADTIRVMLITPAIFEAGWHPSAEQLGSAQIIAARVGRPMSVSGWDFVAKGPKPSRRMAPAGSMYWLKFASAEEAKSWADAHHFNSISDSEQDRLDGFGLVISGRA